MTDLDARAIRRGMRYYIIFESEAPGVYCKTTNEVGPIARSTAPNSRFSVRPLLALEVKEHGDYFYIQYNESDQYYCLQFALNDSAHLTKDSLERLWESCPQQREIDLIFTFVFGRHNCILCPKDRARIREYERDTSAN